MPDVLPLVWLHSRTMLDFSLLVSWCLFLAMPCDSVVLALRQCSAVINLMPVALWLWPLCVHMLMCV